MSFLAIAFVVLTTNAMAYETDQYSHRREPLADSTAVMNEHVNAALAKIVAGRRVPHDRMKMVDAVYQELGGLYWVHHIEAWAWDSPAVDKLNLDRYRSIYSGLPLRVTRVNKLFGIGPTLMINHQRLGTDKLGHFIAQGRKFYRRWLRSGSEAEAAKRSAYTERAIFGAITTGVYSNADLVSNYEGMRFFRSLFENDINADKPAILAWHEDHWEIQRLFDFADYVNAYWDESLNGNGYDRFLRPYMLKRVAGYCDDYRQDPSAYDIDPVVDAELAKRYRILDLEDNTATRVAEVCRGVGTR